MAKPSLKTLMKQQKAALDRARREALLDAGYELKAWNELAVRGWTHRPSFGIEVDIQPAFERVKVVPRGKFAILWEWTDKGTKPHKIRAKNVTRLKFQTAYSARTAPVAKANVGTGRSSGPWVSPVEVNHPGTKARKFTVTFFKNLEPPLHERVNAAHAKAIRRIR